MRLFLLTTLNGLTLAALYFLVASGFTLVFGLMRNVNLAHGSLYLLGAYIGYDVADASGSWYLGVAAGFISMALAGLLMQTAIFRRMAGQDLRQTLVTIGVDLSEISQATRAGQASLDPECPGSNLGPLLELLLEHVPAPEHDEDHPLQAHVTNLDASPYVGRLAICRVRQGTLRT